MPQTYKIEQLGQKAVWENETTKGDFPAILSGVKDEVLVFHDSSGDFDPPRVGDELYGDVGPDKRGNLRFRRKARSRTGGSGGPGGGGGFGPEDIARITRSHSQEMAIRLIAATGSAQGLDLGAKADANALLNGVVRKLTDWFDQDVQRAKPPESAPAPASQPQAEIPAGTEGLEPTAVGNGKSDDDIPF